ncbi:MAG: cysteine desulfurase family protein [Flammeovirgaceae bacterium]
MRVYFDNAATTQIDRAVIEAMLPFMETQYGNPSSTHSHGREVKVALERARKKVASLLGVAPGEIFFTSGGTESDNTAIRCYIEKYKLTHAITSKLEHHAVLHTLENLAENGKVKLSFVEHDDRGNINYDHLEELLNTNQRSLVSLMHGNNEIGTITNIQRVGDICNEFNAIYHCDTVQTMGYYPMDFSKLPIHAAVGSAHKFHGPKGIGFLYVDQSRKIHSYLTGGAQERNMRGGTENVIGIIALAKALEVSFENQEKNQKHILGLKERMKTQLMDKIAGIDFNGMSGDLENSVYKVLNVSLPSGMGNEMLLFNLDLKGISASGGSACSSGANKGSHVIHAIKPGTDRRSIRFSFSKFNTAEEIDYAVEQLVEICQQSTTVPA